MKCITRTFHGFEAQTEGHCLASPGLLTDAEQWSRGKIFLSALKSQEGFFFPAYHWISKLCFFILGFALMPECDVVPYNVLTSLGCCKRGNDVNLTTRYVISYTTYTQTIFSLILRMGYRYGVLYCVQISGISGFLVSSLPPTFRLSGFSIILVSNLIRKLQTSCRYFQCKQSIHENYLLKHYWRLCLARYLWSN